jgi:hypothetical protein
MQTTASNEASPGLDPFVSRAKEIARLTELHAKRKHVLILGMAGMGKSALVRQVCGRLNLVVSGNSEHLGEICDGLEREVGLDSGGLKLLQRKQRLQEALWAAERAVVFDGVGWTGPKVTSFFESLTQRVPVWICTRSEHPWDIGHIWPLLVRFERVELKPFARAETEELVALALAARAVPAGVEQIVDWLWRRSGGSPLILRELLGALARGHYDLTSRAALRRLDLDRRISELFPERPS